MKAILFTLNAAFLFLCMSMYLGTGWSFVLFSLVIYTCTTLEPA
jgi:hypothetical protein